MKDRAAIDALAALLDGAQMDDAPRELASLATLAGRVRTEVELPAPSEAFRAQLRAELVTATLPPRPVDRARAAVRERVERLRSSTRVAVAAMTATSVLGSAGVAVAAQSALPGDALYGAKALTEQARLLLATDDVAAAHLQLAFARERLAELEAAAHELSTDEAIALLDQMDAASQAGTAVLLDDGAGAGTVRDFAGSQRAKLAGVLDDLPLLARPVAEDSLAWLERIRAHSARAAAEAASAPRYRVPDVARGTTFDEVPTADEPGQASTASTDEAPTPVAATDGGDTTTSDAGETQPERTDEAAEAPRPDPDGTTDTGLALEPAPADDTEQGDGEEPTDDGLDQRLTVELGEPGDALETAPAPESPLD